MKSIQELRRYQYEYNYKRFPYLGTFKQSPYSYFKARFYMELSAVLVFVLQRTDITPNMLTIGYCLLGLIAGVLLGLGTEIGVLAAVFIFFSKGILDWSDGNLARIKNQTSTVGAMLDGYGAILGAMGLQIGLGFYVAGKSSMLVFYYLIPLIPLFFLGKLHNFTLVELFKDYVNKNELCKYEQEVDISNEKTNNTDKGYNNGLSCKFNRVRNIVNNILDNRARTVDFICLLLLIEVFTPIFVTWIVFLGFVVKEFLLFWASFFVVIKSDWIKKQLIEKAKELSR